VRESLPQGFQRAEFLLEHGVIDMIIDRRQMRDRISMLLSMLTEHATRRKVEDAIAVPDVQDAPMKTVEDVEGKVTQI
jgi:acetyl-CoA carboxylase carboxyl transferase subunit beta